MRLKISNLSKTYPNGVKALKNLSLDISTGLFGLLGPNGAGKSSLMRTIATLQEADEGSVFLDDLDVLKNKESVRRILGYLPQEFGVYPKMTALDLLDHVAVMKGLVNRGERKDLVEGLLRQTNLYDVRKKKLGGYSGGMKQRFGIAMALVGDPKLIIVDEPTAGLDPTERNRFLNLLASIGENVIVILSTHIVDDVRELCTRMAIIHQGEVLAEGNPQSAIDAINGKVWKKVILKEELEAYLSSHKTLSTHLVAGKTEIRVFSDDRPDASFQPVEADLEDVYFLKINHGAQNGAGRVATP
ncbi:MAG TPA: ABC transporter ATP-binding protein [Blastocatellia bacterium]|nr:ABC transporter ATP-binding protein [Blastocatellia bacterium]